MASSNYRASNPAGANLYQIDTVPGFPLGTIGKGIDADLGEGTFIYLKGVASCLEGSVVTYRPKNHTAILLAANAIGSVGVALGAVLAANYGWFQIAGKAVAKAATSYADDALVYATATGGVIDDAVVAGDRVKQARSCSALDTPATGFAYLDIQYPWMDDATAA